MGDRVRAIAIPSALFYFPSLLSLLGEEDFCLRSINAFLIMTWIN
jgi:hypothetical protein